MMPTVFTFHKEPRLTLVGAGPGDPELITVKAIHVLKQADVVLYDALVSPEILRLIPNGVPAFSVGKRAGEHSHTQEEINQLIVEFAYLYGHVVRLKGGDPFVFGRGAEEIEFAESHGITTAVVPGITSALAVPASLKIPVTARGASESFWVVTGTTKNGTISGDIALAAQSTATVVILMGLQKIEEIMACFCKHGKSEIPVAVIQHGTMSQQRSIVTTAAQVATQVQLNGIEAPAIIIVGEVVRYAESLREIVAKVKSA